MKILLLLALLLWAAPAHAKCETDAGWPPGKPCRDADQVGLREGETDKSLQAAFDSGDLASGAVNGAPPQDATVEALPTCTTEIEGARRRVTDSLTVGSCDTGGGSEVTVCECTAGVWEQGGGGGGHEILDDGTPLPPQPQLDFGPGILCSDFPGVSYCDVWNVGDGGDVMVASQWATIVGYPYVDYAWFANSSIGIDGDEDGLPEFFDTPGASMCFDITEDGVCELQQTPTDFSLFGGGAIPTTISSAGDVAVAGLLTLASGTGDTTARFNRGVRIGNGSGTSLANSASMGRHAGSDKIFEDTDGDFPTQLAPETTPSTTSNAEAFVTDMQRRLSGDASSTSTTGAEVTGLKLDLDFIGAYRIEYQILDQCNGSAGTGLAFGIEYTGTETSLYCRREFVSDGTTAATGTIDDVANTNTGQLVEGYAASAASTTAPNLGPNAGCTTTNTNLERIECNLLTTTAGDLTFWLASETGGTSVTVKANSTVRATPFP